jgi:error-prone DNA polymerase
VIGARLVSVTGPVQNASGVIHVVAEDVRDLTPLLRGLAQEHPQALANADALRQSPERHRHPRAGDALVTGLKETHRALAGAQVAKVMPKGRNFH